MIGDIFPINSGSATTTGTLKTGSATTTSIMPVGSLFFANIGATGTSDSFSSFVDSGGLNTYSFVQTSDASNPAISLVFSVLTHSLPVGSTFTATTSDGTTWGIGNGYFVTGATGGLDKQTSVNNDAGATSLSLSTGSLSEATEIIIGGFNNNASGTGTWTEANGFTTLHNDTFNITSYRIVSNSSSVTWNPSWQTSGIFNAVLASFKSI